MFKLKNKNQTEYILSDAYLSQPFAADEIIDLEELFSYEALHKSTYYNDGGIKAALLSDDLELLDENDLPNAVWRFSSPNVEYITLSASNIETKSVELSLTPRKGMHFLSYKPRSYSLLQRNPAKLKPRGTTAYNVGA